MNAHSMPEPVTTVYKNKSNLPSKWKAWRIVGLLVAAALLTGGCSGEAPPPPVTRGGEAFNPEIWINLEEPTLGFKTRFPGPWEHRVDYMETPQGAATVHIFDYWHLAFRYGITVARFPPGVADMSEPDHVLNFAIQSLVDEHGAVISYQERINVGGYPALRAILLLPESFLKSARLNTLIILRNEYVYRISTAGVGNFDSIEYYMRSFELTPIRIDFDSRNPTRR
jgi:hypothetical protein